MRDITAVVKNIPIAYLSMKLNWAFYPVLCISKSTNLWMIKDSMNLLKKMIPKKYPIIKAPWRTLLWSCFSASCAINVNKKYIPTVNPPRTETKTTHEKILLYVLIDSSITIFSQAISWGSGAWTIFILPPLSEKCLQNCYLLTLVLRTSLLSISVWKHTIALPQFTFYSSIKCTNLCFSYLTFYYISVIIDFIDRTRFSSSIIRPLYSISSESLSFILNCKVWFQAIKCPRSTINFFFLF